MVYGQLTGNPTAVALDGNLEMPIPGTGERYGKHFTYNDSNLVTSVTEDDGTQTQFTYHPNSLVASKLIFHNGTIIQRMFFEYDHNAILTLKIVDDGSTPTKDNLTDVTQRLITRIKACVGEPFGVPEKTDEFFLDLATGQEVLIKCTIASYFPDGHLSSQAIYDSNGAPQITLNWTYDPHGNTKTETNALGETTTYTYDANDNKATEQNATHIITYSYDLSNRLRHEKRTSFDNIVTWNEHRYDVLGNRTHTVNELGAETSYEYDDFGRPTKIQYPSVSGPTGQLVRPTETFTYDPFGNVTSHTTPTGGITNTTYNSRGKPTSIHYPDGTTEKMTYQLNSRLAEKVDKNGTKTRYGYDGFGNVTSTEEYSPAGELFRKTSAVYNAFHILTSTDADGMVTTYSYDGVGRLISQTKGDQKTTFEYDPLGRLFKTFDWITADSARVTVTLYDKLDRIIEKRIEDLQGTVLSFASNKYNSHGNIIRSQEGESVTETLYDGHKRPIQITDPLTNITRIKYDDQALQQNETDPLGNQTITTYDHLHRVASVVKKDPFGALTYKEEILYDASNNERIVINHVIANGKTERTITTFKEYNLHNQLVAQTEAQNTPEQKISRYTYNSAGELEIITKNDGVILTHTYDPLGRLSRVVSSDGTIDFSYTYNAQDLVMTASDGKRQTVRKYDSYGRMEQETLANGIVITYTYDALDRPVTVTIPDRTLTYTYDPLFLKTAESYEILSRSPLGDPTSVKLIGGSKVAYVYDNIGQCLSITHPSFTQAGKYNPLGNLISTHLNGTEKITTYDALSQITQETSHTYAYDSLGNRTKHNEVASQFNTLNQVANPGYTYDRNGNLSNDPTTAYTYDALDRLVGVHTLQPSSPMPTTPLEGASVRLSTGKKRSIFTRVMQRLALSKMVRSSSCAS